MTIDERVGMAVDPSPAAISLVEDLGDTEIPTTLRALGVSRELNAAALDERQPCDLAIASTVQVLDGPGPSTPLRCDGSLAFRRLDAPRPNPPTAPRIVPSSGNS
jgi:hypothetical protein